MWSSLFYAWLWSESVRDVISPHRLFVSHVSHIPWKRLDTENSWFIPSGSLKPSVSLFFFVYVFPKKSCRHSWFPNQNNLFITIKQVTMSMHSASIVLIMFTQHSRAGISYYQLSNELAVATSADALPKTTKHDSKRTARQKVTKVNKTWVKRIILLKSQRN